MSRNGNSLTDEVMGSGGSLKAVDPLTERTAKIAIRKKRDSRLANGANSKAPKKSRADKYASTLRPSALDPNAKKKARGHSPPGAAVSPWRKSARSSDQGSPGLRRQAQESLLAAKTGMLELDLATCDDLGSGIDDVNDRRSMSQDSERGG